MSAVARKSLLAVCFAASGIALLSFLWQRRRKQEREASSCYVPEVPEFVFSDATAREVSVKLESLKWSRLENIEEEDRLPDEERSPPPVAAAAPSGHVIQPTAEPQDIQLVPDIGDSAAGSLTAETKCAADIERAGVLQGEAASDKAINGESETVASDSALPTETNRSAGLDTAFVNLSSMTEKDAVGPDGQEHLPDIQAALKDPLYSSSTCSFLGSPVKSESSESQRSCEAWSDLIELDEQEAKGFLSEDRIISEKLLNMELARVAGRHDSGVASPTEELPTAKENKPISTSTSSSQRTAQRKARLNSGEDAGIGGSDHGDNTSDSGQGSDTCLEDTQLLTYHFHIQDYLCGKLIGKNGVHINKLKAATNCNIILKDLKETKSQQKKIRLKPRDRQFGEGKQNLCIIEGTRSNIDKCLDLVKEKFIPNPELCLEQVNKPENTPLSLYNGSVTLSLAEGIMHDVYVSSVVNGGHIFIQQPAHPTFSALERLDSCMYNTYTQFSCPDLPRPILANTICAASSNGGWYRSQVVSYDASTDMCDIKFTDYGGYDTVPASDLKQIRTDFLTLPFQGIECYLANIIPTDDETSCSILEELVFNQVVQARMIGMNEEGVPMIHLYRANNGQTVMINRELVDRHAAQWIEATIVPLLPPCNAEPLT